MSEIDFFDSFLKGTMSDSEIKDFHHRLDNDKEFAGDFKIYLATVNGFCKEEEQDNLEFASAMRRLSSQQLKEIIGANQRKKSVLHISRQKVLWITSMAAMIVVVFSISFNIQKQADIKTDNLIVEYNAMQTNDRAGGESLDLVNMENKDIEAILPILSDEYDNVPTDDVQSKQIAGINLAMAYLKIHNRNMAIQVLQQLKSLYPEDMEFAAQCDKIIHQLK